MDSSKRAVILKPEKEKSLLRKHPWIFSGAIASFPSIEPGEILPVYSASGVFLAQAYFHPENSLAGRILAFSEEPIPFVLREKILRAAALRELLACGNGYRLINGEEDGIPGLVIDHYADVLVIQANTSGIERLKGLIVEMLCDLFNPRAIYEKSSSFSREQEGLPPSQGFLFGEQVSEVEIEENGLRFLVSFEKGQKTGFFLDQREMRKFIEAASKDKKVLNTFAYTGGFSLAALKGGAKRVDSVDTDRDACLLLEKNLERNGFSGEKHRLFREDVFDFLRVSKMDYDLIILDPPAFAKKKGDIHNACKGYKEIHKQVFQKVSRPCFLLTSCCSYHIDEKLFQNLVFQSAIEAGREVKIIGRHHHASDHPISLAHPEGSYLKSLYLYIESP